MNRGQKSAETRQPKHEFKLVNTPAVGRAALIKGQTCSDKANFFSYQGEEKKKKPRGQMTLD